MAVGNSSTSSVEEGGFISRTQEAWTPATGPAACRRAARLYYGAVRSDWLFGPSLPCFSTARVQTVPTFVLNDEGACAATSSTLCKWLPASNTTDIGISMIFINGRWVISVPICYLLALKMKTTPQLRDHYLCYF